MQNSYHFIEIFSPKDLINILFFEDLVFIRFFLESDEDPSEIPNDKFFTESDLQNISQEYNKYYIYKDTLYKCIRFQEVELPKNIWRNYSQVCLLASINSFRASFMNNNAFTYINKDDFLNFKKQMQTFGAQPIAEWIVLPNSNLLTAPHILRTRTNIITNIVCDEIIEIYDKPSEEIVNKVTEFKEYYLPQVTIDGPSEITADSFAEFTVNCTHSTTEHEAVEHEYEIQCIQGYAPNTRVTVKDGKGSFKIYATGLVKGDTLRFKINDKFWTDKAEKTLTVV